MSLKTFIGVGLLLCASKAADAQDIFYALLEATEKDSLRTVYSGRALGDDSKDFYIVAFDNSEDMFAANGEHEKYLRKGQHVPLVPLKEDHPDHGFLSRKIAFTEIEPVTPE